MREKEPCGLQTVEDASLVAAAASLGFPAVQALGDSGIFSRPRLGLLCSQRFPGDLILETYDTIRALRDVGITVVSGFHSPMEKECLYLLLRGAQPIIICPARGLTAMRIPTAWQPHIQSGRMLVVSPFAATIRRPTEETARQRNAFVAVVAGNLLLPYASPGGHLETLSADAICAGRKVFTLDNPANEKLIAIGATPVRPTELSLLSERVPT